VSRVAAARSALSSTSATKIVHARRSSRQTASTTLAYSAAIRGFLEVGRAGWLASFQGEIAVTSGKRSRNARTASRYSAAEGRRHWRRLASRRHSSTAPRECSKETSGWTPARRAAAR